MTPRRSLGEEQRRLLRIVGLMPLVSVSNLMSILRMDERAIRRTLHRLRRGGWVWSVRRGMTERLQERWFLTRHAAEMLYANDHEHASPGRRRGRCWTVSGPMGCS